MWTCPRRPERALAAALLLALTAQAHAFGWPEAVQLARQRAGQEAAVPAPLPQWLQELPPQEWDQIRPDPRRTVTAARGGDLAPFAVYLHHPGGLYQRGVRVHLIEGEDGAPPAVRALPFDPGAFFYGAQTTRGPAPPELGYAGLGVLARMEDGTRVPIASFLGASFMRAGRPDPGGGTRSRAATLDVGLPQGEEFPSFTDLYVDTRGGPTDPLRVYALLDSRRLSGAYEFLIHDEGTQVRTEVRAALFAREALDKLGVGALDSLYYYGAERPRPDGEWRPEVHAADTLLMRSPGGVFVARPLNNPASLAMEDYAPPRPLPYGLMQRDRRFDHYQDLDQRLETLPDAWLVPGRDFPDGTLELLELPLGDPFNHNVLAHWVVDNPPAPGQMLSFGYTLRWGDVQPQPAALGQVLDVRSAAVTRPQQVLIVQVDFSGAPDAGSPAPVKAQGLALEGGHIIGHSLSRADALGQWRLTLRVAPAGRGPVVLEARLTQDGRVLTETWHGVFGPERLP